MKNNVLMRLVFMFTFIHQMSGGVILLIQWTECWQSTIKPTPKCADYDKEDGLAIDKDDHKYGMIVRCATRQSIQDDAMGPLLKLTPVECGALEIDRSD